MAKHTNSNYTSNRKSRSRRNGVKVIHIHHYHHRKRKPKEEYVDANRYCLRDGIAKFKEFFGQFFK